MLKWKQFLESLDSQGGHIVWLSGAVALGVILHALGHAEVGKDIMMPAGGALLAMLRSNPST